MSQETNEKWVCLQHEAHTMATYNGDNISYPKLAVDGAELTNILNNFKQLFIMLLIRICNINI